MKHLKIALFLAVTLFFAGTQFALAQVEEEAERKVEETVEVKKEKVETKTMEIEDDSTIKTREVKEEETELKRLDGEGTKEDDLDMDDDENDGIDDN